MTELTLPIIAQRPRLVVAEISPAPTIDLSTDDLTARVQTNMRAIRGVQIGMACGDAPASGDTGRLRVGLCLHPLQDEITEAIRYRGMTYGVSPSAQDGGASYPWLNDGGADNLWPTITTPAAGGQLQNGGFFAAEFDSVAPLCARYVNIDWRKGDLGAGLLLGRLTVIIHFADV